MRIRTRVGNERRGAAILELAVLLPLLAFLFVAGVDFARVFYHQLTLTNCARNGAEYGSRDVLYAADVAGIEKAALADATNLSPAPTVTSGIAVDEAGNPCVRVTVSWNFSTITNYPGVPGTVPLSRTVQMRIAPTVAKNSVP